MLLQFLFMWDDRLGRINVAKHCIELHHADTAPLPSVLYQANPKTQEFEKSDVDKMLTENIMNPRKLRERH